MIILNGNKFASNDNEFTDSLFQQGGTCVGYYKRLKDSVVLQDHNRNKVGVVNKHGVLCCATKQENGKYWYSFAPVKLVGEYESYMAEVEELEALMKNN